MACPCSCASSSAWLDQQTKTCELARGARLSRVCAGENPGSTALYSYCLTSSSSTLKRRKGDAQNKDKNVSHVTSSRSKSTTTREYVLLGPRRPKESGGGGASGGPPSVLPPRFRPKRTGSSGSAVGAGAVSWLSSVRRTAIAILRRCLHRANAAAARLADMIAFWIAEKPPVDGAFVSRLLGETMAGG